MRAWVKKVSIGGMKTFDLKYYIVPSLARKPDSVVIHCGVNDLMNASGNSQQISNELKHVAETILQQSPTCRILISGIAFQSKYENLDANIRQLNGLLMQMC